MLVVLFSFWGKIIYFRKGNARFSCLRFQYNIIFGLKNYLHFVVEGYFFKLNFFLFKLILYKRQNLVFFCNIYFFLCLFIFYIFIIFSTAECADKSTCVWVGKSMVGGEGGSHNVSPTCSRWVSHIFIEHLWIFEQVGTSFVWTNKITLERHVKVETKHRKQHFISVMQKLYAH